MDHDTEINGADFDLVGVAMTRADEGAPFALRHPQSGLVLRNHDKSVVMIKLLGQHSQRFRTTLREIQKARAAFHSNARQADPMNPAEVPPEMVESEDTETLVACTVDWTIKIIEGQPFPFNRANAYKLYTDPRFIWLRAPAMAFIQSDGNFLSEGSGNSSALQSIASDF